MRLQFITLALSGIMLWGCGNSANQKSNEHSEITHQDEHQYDDENETLKLNGGEKWVVNEEMKPYILEEEEIIHHYIASQSQDFHTLAAQLQEKNSGLINSCTMKGESHDELHKWLHPHMELIEKLSNADSFKKAEEIISELVKSFETFKNYFQ